MQLRREHGIVLCFLALYVPCNALLYSVRDSSNTPATSTTVYVVVLYMLCITASVFWTSFALALHPCCISTRLFPRESVAYAITHADGTKQDSVFITELRSLPRWRTHDHCREMPYIQLLRSHS